MQSAAHRLLSELAQCTLLCSRRGRALVPAADTKKSEKVPSAEKWRLIPTLAKGSRRKKAKNSESKLKQRIFAWWCDRGQSEG